VHTSYKGSPSDPTTGQAFLIATELQEHDSAALSSRCPVGVDSDTARAVASMESSSECTGQELKEEFRQAAVIERFEEIIECSISDRKVQSVQQHVLLVQYGQKKYQFRVIKLLKF
jgi:hypothetical protein